MRLAFCTFRSGGSGPGYPQERYMTRLLFSTDVSITFPYKNNRADTLLLRASSCIKFKCTIGTVQTTSRASMLPTPHQSFFTSSAEEYDDFPTTERSFLCTFPSLLSSVNRLLQQRSSKPPSLGGVATSG